MGICQCVVGWGAWLRAPGWLVSGGGVVAWLAGVGSVACSHGHVRGISLCWPGF